MGKDGKAEPAVKRVGHLIGWLRKELGLTRWTLATNLLYSMDEGDPVRESVSESWLARIETGRKVIVSRATLEAFCRALECDERDRVRLLLYADRNVLSNGSDEPDEATEAIAYVMHLAYTKASDVIKDAMKQRKACEMDDAELVELVTKALKLVVRQ